MLYHTPTAARNGSVVALRPTFASERLLDLPETGEVWIERHPLGWRVHHADYDGDHAAIIADRLRDRGTAISAALSYALSVIRECGR
jgi:hypothetical protein